MHTGDGHIVHQCLSGRHLRCWLTNIRRVSSRSCTRKSGSLKMPRISLRRFFSTPIRSYPLSDDGTSSIRGSIPLPRIDVRIFIAIRNDGLTRSPLPTHLRITAQIWITRRETQKRTTPRRIGDAPGDLSSSFSPTLYGWHEKQGDCPDAAGIPKYHQPETHASQRKTENGLK